jgi:hypothetical protein
MMDHDVVIAKAGGATTQEAIAAHIPMLVTHIVPGQEEGNFLLLKKYDAGFHTPTAAAVLATLDRLFLPPGEAFVHATRQLKRLSRREPALTMAKHLLETRKRQTGGKHPGKKYDVTIVTSKIVQSHETQTNPRRIFQTVGSSTGGGLAQVCGPVENYRGRIGGRPFR